MNDNKKLIDACVNAHKTIVAVYEWLDIVKNAGGTTSISGVASCNSMIKSLRKNKPRIDKLITDPLIDAINEAKK